MERFLLLILGCLGVSRVTADSLSPPVNVTIKEVKANFAVVSWDIPEGDPVIGFAITQQKKDVHMLRFIQEVNTTTRSCALWDLEEETDYIVHVQFISMSGTSPLSEPILFRTPKEAETQASKSKDEVTMEEVGQSSQLRAGELIIIVVVLIMWAGVIALFCRQYDIIKDNEPNNKTRTKPKTRPSAALLNTRRGGCCAVSSSPKTTTTTTGCHLSTSLRMSSGSHAAPALRRLRRRGPQDSGGRARPSRPAPVRAGIREAGPLVQAPTKPGGGAPILRRDCDKTNRRDPNQ
ncbi:hypothetical protein OJAV_G00105080 [Oryzias javanicus]|uniref:Fibronectin type-III domain-containing protein n=1 Tax=Oryzias javanicus TaxID=123683 RepID=A0A437CY76_ORYJA|nr:hypothetical protein OJAV_G00105080 [Oryzias javanicus]